MVHRCCISSCKMNVRVAEAKGLSYHCFPLKDPHREKWIQAILPHVDKPENFKIVQGYTRVCSRHFRIKEYSLDSKKRARLNSNAVPSVFPRKNTPVFVQVPLEAAKSQVASYQNAAAKAVNANISKSTAEDSCDSNEKIARTKDESNSSPKLTESISSSDQKILDLLKAVSVDNLDGLDTSSAADDVHSDGSNDDKQDQTKRKRRKCNRTAFARTSKTKQKKSSNPLTSCLTDSTFDADTLDDLNLCAILGLTRNNSVDLETELEIHSRDASLSLNGIASDNGLHQSTSSSSSISLNDPLKLEDLNLMSIEEQELLQSIQAVSLDCGEADMNLNMKNIHLGPSDLVSEDLLSASSEKPLHDINPILLEDALISSASEMSLQSSADKNVATKQVTKRMRAPYASEIEKLACDLERSSLLTSVNLPGEIDLALDDDVLRLPVTEFSSANSLGLGLADNLTTSDSTSHLDGSSCTDLDLSPKREQGSFSKASKSVNKKGSVPKKKLVGISKKPKNNDKYFGKFSVERFRDSNKDIEYYTSFPTYPHFEAFFNSLEIHVEKLKVTDIMHGVADLIRNQQQEAQGNRTVNEDNVGRDNGEDQKRRPITGRSMHRIDELFMTLIRLKRRLPEKVLGHMFYVSQPTVSRTIRAWTMLLSKLLEPIPSSTESVSTESLKLRQSSSKSNGEHNYFTNKGIYIPDSFRQLFQSDVTTSIIASAHNPRVNSAPNSLSSSVETIGNNNNKEVKSNDCLSALEKSRSASFSKTCNCNYECSCPSAPSLSDSEEIITFADSNILAPCSEVEIYNNDYYPCLLVKE